MVTTYWLAEYADKRIAVKVERRCKFETWRNRRRRHIVDSKLIYPILNMWVRSIDGVHYICMETDGVWKPERLLWPCTNPKPYSTLPPVFSSQLYRGRFKTDRPKWKRAPFRASSLTEAKRKFKEIHGRWAHEMQRRGHNWEAADSEIGKRAQRK